MSRIRWRDCDNSISLVFRRLVGLASIVAQRIFTLLDETFTSGVYTHHFHTTRATRAGPRNTGRFTLLRRSKKPLRSKPEDQEKLISYASRYRSIHTDIDEARGVMVVWTTFLDTSKPTSKADEFQLEVVSNDPPEMPEREYQRRMAGKIPS
jgi:hypothetical protein